MTEVFTAVLTTPNEFARDTFKRAMDHAAAMMKGGEACLVSVGPALEPLGIQQRKFLHGVVLKQISENAKVNGQRYTIDLWKRFYKERFLGFEWEMVGLPGAKRATPRKRWKSTEDLGVRAYAAFTNEVIDHAVVELGVEFVFTNEERELIAKKPARQRGTA